MLCRIANPLLSLWNVATAVTSTVKAQADQLVKSVVDTDWRTELSQFGKEVGEESRTLKEQAAELVEHLPEQVGHLPEKVWSKDAMDLRMLHLGRRRRTC